MKKPININQQTWKFLNNHLSSSELISAIRNPGKYLMKLNFTSKPSLTIGTVIELPNEVEYIITSIGSKQLANNEKRIRLRRLIDQKEEIFSLNTVINAIRSGNTFDQIDIPPN